MKYLAALFVLVFVSCKTQSVYTKVTINEQYSLELPANMEQAELDENATLEYQQAQQELYVIVIEEDKKTLNDYGLQYDLETYARLGAKAIDSTYKDKLVLQKIGNHKAMHCGLKGKMSNNGTEYDVVYRLTVIETPLRYYQLLIWTMDKRYESNRADMEHIESSFLELAAKEEKK